MASRISTKFPIGSKQVFLPTHPISMLRPRGNQAPNFARFIVPLNWTKFDMRDYLLHVYNVGSRGVRSNVVQKPIATHPVTGRAYRPLSTKEMIVELEKPFVWPAELTIDEKKTWNPEALAGRVQRQRDMQKYAKMNQQSGFWPIRDLKRDQGDPNIKRRREEAEKILETGKWENHRPLDPKWQAKQ